MVTISRQSNLKKAIAVLSRLPIFQDITEDELAVYFTPSSYEIMEFNKGEIIHLQNELCRSLEIILEGKVIVQNIDENGNVLTIETFVGCDMIGANLIFSSKNVYPMTVTAAKKTTIVRMDRALILTLCHRSVLFTEGLLKAISDKTVIMTEKINAISGKTIRQCIIDFLRQEKHRQASNVIQLALSKKELAERFGVARSSLGRELNKMRKDGLIEYDARSITLKE